MCITQSRRRKSLGLNLAAYAAASGKSKGIFLRSAPSRSPTEVQNDTYTTNGFPENGSTFMEVDHDGTSFATAPFPDATTSVSTSTSTSVSTSSTSTSVSTSSTSATVSTSTGEEYKPLEGKYVQGVYIPPSKPKPKRVRKPQKPGMTAKMHERHFVQHNYHDHSRDVPDDPEAEPLPEEVEAAVLQQKKSVTVRGSKKGKSISFPRKLHYLLDQIERDGLAHVISWLPHGRAFAVHKPKEFSESVMPKYFNQSKLTSFQRQLNLYGFCRLTRGRDAGGYYNEYFLRGMPFLTKSIIRTRVKGTKFKAASNPDCEPNFYAMRPVSLPQTHPLAAVVAPTTTGKVASTLVSASEESSLSASSSSASSVEEGYGCIKHAYPVNSPPNQVVVPSVKTDIASYAEALEFTPMVAAPEQANFSFPSIVDAPSVKTEGNKKKTSICDLWDCLDVFEPNPYVSPKSSPTKKNEAAQAAVPAVSWGPMPVGSSSSPQRAEPPAVVTAPPSRSDSGAVAAAAAAPPSPSSSGDPLLDLVEDWACQEDDMMADVVEQAIDNDLDFGHLLDIIAQD